LEEVADFKERALISKVWFPKSCLVVKFKIPNLSPRKKILYA